MLCTDEQILEFLVTIDSLKILYTKESADGNWLNFSYEHKNNIIEIKTDWASYEEGGYDNFKVLINDNNVQLNHSEDGRTVYGKFNSNTTEEFNSLEEVMHFYNQGGGDGMLLTTPFQTLSADKLNLTQTEMNEVIAFMKQLSDNPFINDKPLALPKFNSKELDNRVWGGEY